MREIFVGVAVAAPAARVSAAIRDAALAVEELQPAGAIVLPSPGIAFDSQADALAAELSREFGAALVIRYDARADLRTARLFRDGAVATDFGECDELFLTLDDAGRPRDDIDPTAFCRLDPLQEYRSLKNAIEIDLEALGAGNWQAVKRMMARAERAIRE